MDDLQRELSRLEATLGPRTAVIDELASMRQELACGSAGPARFTLANVRIASPCKVRWADMTGDERVRVCDGCERPVFNLSEMTREQAEAVLASRGITPCVRFYRRSDGTVMTSDCPPGARRSRRLAVVAAGMLGSSTAMAEPATPEPAPPDAPAAEPTTVEMGGPIVDSQEWTMGVIIADPQPEHTTLEWSTWARVGAGIATHVPDVVARSTTEPMPTSVGIGEAALGADLSVSVAMRGDLRLGAWGEMRTLSGPVLGGELIVGGMPPHPYLSEFHGGGSVVLRVGANEHVLSTALGFGYTGAWTRYDPWIGFLQHVVGVRLVATMNRSLDTRDWSATLGVEADPIGVARWVVHLISD